MQFLLSVLFFLFSLELIAQEKVVNITPDMVNKQDLIPLGNLDGWHFKKGNDLSWSQNDVDGKEWIAIKPVHLTGKMADENGRLEGWLRLKIKLDTAFGNTPFDISLYMWAAADLYVDGNQLFTYGNTGSNGLPYQEYNPSYKIPRPFPVEKGSIHTIALHIVDYISSLPPYELKSSERFNNAINLSLPAYKNNFLSERLINQTFKSAWIVVSIIICSLFWLLTLLNPGEKNLRLISITSSFFSLTIITDQYILFPGLNYNAFRVIEIIWELSLSISTAFTIVLVARIFERPVSALLKMLIILILSCGLLIVFFPNQIFVIFQTVTATVLYSYYIVTSWKKLRGAQWALVAGLLTGMTLGILLSTTVNQSTSPLYIKFLYTGVFLSSPLSLLVYVSMRFKEIIQEVRRNAAEVVKLSEDKKQQALNQQKILAEEVARQTIELRMSIQDLKAAQAQLIQSEKMASLGELTAGIAHEIQNPLNFVNNFSDVNSELIDEAGQEIDKGNLSEAKAILNSLKENQEKINHHGKRADSIVKGMLQHSRSNSGAKEPTDVNGLCDEYLRLAYNGFRAKDKSFNVVVKTDFDESIGKINMVPQDIGRVILNLINNAFYAVSAKALAMTDSNYEPTVTVTTKKENDKLKIAVADNGTGIPDSIKDKIFQPFFTTKPAGQGTGLGLSLSYDIIKSHGGELKVETKEGEGSKFVIQLPV